MEIGDTLPDNAEGDDIVSTSMEIIELSYKDDLGVANLNEEFEFIHRIQLLIWKRF